MKIPKLQIGIITASIPIIQGGMRIRVLLSSLTSAVASEGGIHLKNHASYHLLEISRPLERR